MQLHLEIGQILGQLGLKDIEAKADILLDPSFVQAIEGYPSGAGRQAAYLAEEIYLAYYQAQGQIETGLVQLFNHFAAPHFPNDRHKQSVLNQLLADMITPKQSHCFEKLTTFLEQPHHFPQQIADIPQALIALVEQAHPTEATVYGDLVILPANAPYCVIGDSHGDAASTQQIIEAILAQQSNAMPFIIFMGDYVHNGLRSIDNLIAILSLKRQYPNRVILLSGNHDYRETYQTALNEYFNKHWQAAIENPHLDKTPPHHYGHLRLDFVREFGVERGEQLSRSFEEWGQRLPYICLAPDGTMISHSLGKAPHLAELSWENLMTTKTDDLAAMTQLGMSEWGYQRRSQHAAMVNNRVITNDLLAEFEQLGLKRFIVGHTHYRSGDRLFSERLITVCSSHPNSPDAGHYMYQEMVLNRHKNRATESLSAGNAVPCYVSVTPWHTGKPEVAIRLVDF